MVEARILLEGELKRIQVFVQEHQGRLPESDLLPSRGKASVLELAAFISGFYLSFERLMEIIFRAYRIDLPSTLQHREALIDAAILHRSDTPVFLPATTASALKQIASVHYSTRHQRPQELDAQSITIVSRLIPPLWHIIREHYKELLKNNG